MDNYIDHHNDTQKSFKNIFAYILEKGKTTRREIQKDTNYSWSSVSSVVSVLINKGLVYETESIHYKVGRGTSYIVPNGNKFVSIGVDMNSIGFSLIVIGIDGDKKYEEKFDYKENTKEYTLNLLLEVINKGIQFAKDKYTVVCIGVSCQGHVDVPTHSTLEKFPFCQDIENFNVKEFVENKFHIYTYVEHDTRCVLEDFRVHYNEIPLPVCIFRVVSGIGFAITVNDQMFDEPLWPVDFGHMIVHPNGEICSCGKKGCLEAYASTTGICRRAGVKDFSIIDSNRDKYRDILNDAGYYLGVAAANMIRIFGARNIILTGKAINNDATLIAKIISAYKQYEPEERAKIIYIDDLSPSYGVARLAFKEKNNNGGSFND